MSHTVISVPHTGTNFIKKRFGVLNYIHSWVPWGQLYETAKNAEHIYIPMRNPIDVYHTWVRRNRLHGIHGVEDWCRSWYQLNAIHQLFDCDVIYVDKQEDPRIDNWEKVASNPKPMPEKWMKVDYAVLWHLPIVRNHYRQPR